MKSYLSLIPISAKIRNKQNRMTLFCIILSVFLVNAIFSMADMELRSQKTRAIAEYGNWHISLSNITGDDALLIGSRPDVVSSSWYNTLNYRLGDGYFINGKDTVICGMEEALVTDIGLSSIAEGTFPSDDTQVILTQNSQDILDVEIGDTVYLDNPSGTPLPFTVSGFVTDTSILMRSDALGAVVTAQALKNISFHAENISLTDTDMVYYVRFSESTNIQKAVSDIKNHYGWTDDMISENAALLGSMGQSSDSYIVSIYIMALLLFVLVLIAGILMITGSLNSNIEQRTEFFGMLRCIGADKKQIMRLVRMEALNWCKIAIPAGSLLAMIVVWALCAVLRILSPGYFSTMPVLSVSWIGMISGIVVGILTVLLAAQSPAGKAARVSPLTAVSGNTSRAQAFRRAANTRFCRVETALGIYHAKKNKRSFLLMVSSFSLTIVLFLSFTALIGWINHSISPLKPYTPDLSIASGNNSCSISGEIIQELEDMSFVKKAYGRMAENNIPAQTDRGSVNIHLISYEKQQFDWAEEVMLEGSAGKAEENVSDDTNYVLTIFNEDNPYKTGDRLSLPYGDVVIAGVLSESPFKSDDGEIMICSEDTFRRLTGKSDYTIIDIQLKSRATDKDVSSIRSLSEDPRAGAGTAFSDRRLSNKEAKGAYYSLTLFVYGFLAVIAMITVFNIINSISMSVSARTRQYGAMRAIGMDKKQLTKMIAAEALTYAVFGSITGCAAGLLLHKLIFYHMVTARWGEPWSLPLGALAVIMCLMAGACGIAVNKPVKRIQSTSIVQAVNEP